MTTERIMTVPARELTAATADAPPGSRSDQSGMRGFEVDFLPADFRVGQMRRITSAHLRLWDLTALCDTATLAVSELVTNAVRHGQGNPVGLRVTSSDGELRIEVTDGNPTPARLREAGEAAENGRGLLLIAALAKEWGVSYDGRMTWCSLAIPEGRS
ncbi:ATP-binding protein [Streptomyces sp. ADMS]|uniref:ATP-binding protein n=1 Tax=Streptomyces sp. ADMS TaxID=3071415 RepID=UPI00296E4287|nr:ATP-binding protein [Streptomyces sp. ADMS]MDW4907809.1 ATP-binding protein [Streptomyces sp. ADMS]